MFITQEQKEMILERVNKTNWKDWEDPNDWIAYVLDKCIEKKIPQVRVHYSNLFYQYEFFIEPCIDVVSTVNFCITQRNQMANKSTDCSLEYKYFKELITSGMEIVEWMEKELAND